ncbi:hypothetical protein PoB_001537100 [Plakobranchus ocellatus]|uniref:Uncharacterized protein n=1 Tax=Plakobranchus ocellatus TaxID=259542 RepID=A0AAV3YNZ9_9GAST|nr:hypothetical protein PoB_001537100 [Plakobranchus ocellatus]
MLEQSQCCPEVFGGCSGNRQALNPFTLRCQVSQLSRAAGINQDHCQTAASLAAHSQKAWPQAKLPPGDWGELSLERLTSTSRSLCNCSVSLH